MPNIFKISLLLVVIFASVQSFAKVKTNTIEETEAGLPDPNTISKCCNRPHQQGDAWQMSERAIDQLIHGAEQGATTKKLDSSRSTL